MLLVFLDPLVLIDIGVLPWVLFSHLVALLFTSFHEEHKECEGWDQEDVELVEVEAVPNLQVEVAGGAEKQA